MRTALALFATGVALEVPIQPGYRVAAAGVLGLPAAVQGWVGWMSTERSLREQRALPGPRLGVLLVAGVLVAAVLIVVGFVV